MKNPFSIITDAVGAVGSVLDSLLTSDEEKLAGKAVLLDLQTTIIAQTLAYEKQLIEGQAEIITTEAKADSWITRTWRPIVMLTFTAIVVYAFVTGTEIPPDMWFLLKLGLGGYLGGRSVEKSVEKIGAMMKSREET